MIVLNGTTVEIVAMMNKYYPNKGWGVADNTVKFNSAFSQEIPTQELLEQYLITTKIEITKETNNAPILAQLEVLDKKSIRALREGDTIRIAALEGQAALLRSQLMQ